MFSESMAAFSTRSAVTLPTPIVSLIRFFAGISDNLFWRT